MEKRKGDLVWGESGRVLSLRGQIHSVRSGSEGRGKECFVNRGEWGGGWGSGGTCPKVGYMNSA